MNDAQGSHDDDDQSISDSTRRGQAAMDICLQELPCADAEHTYENVDLAGSANEEEPYYAVPNPDYADSSLPHALQSADD